MSATPIKISALVFQEGDWWVAQCLEYDIAAQAETLDDLPYELERTLMVHVYASLEENRQPFEGFKRAPQKYWDLYERSQWEYTGEPLPFEAEGAQSAIPIMPKIRRSDSAPQHA